MNWFQKLFEPKPSSQPDHNSPNAHNAFTTGKKIWREAVSIKGEGWKESQLIKINEALKYFDEAIKNGFDESEVFSFRGSCLNSLGYYFEALEDYNEAIKRNPRKAVASNYHMRSLIKDSLFDFEGSLADLKEAIRLSRLKNEDNEYWNNYAKSTGFTSLTAFYEAVLPTENEIHFKRSTYSNKDFVAAELKKIRRREKEL